MSKKNEVDQLVDNEQRKNRCHNYIVRPERGKDELRQYFIEWVDAESGDIQYDWVGDVLEYDMEEK